MIFFKKKYCWWDWEKNCRKKTNRVSLVGMGFLVFFGLITWRMKKIIWRSSWLKIVIFYKMVRRNTKQRLEGGLDKGIGRENLSKIFIDLPPPMLYDIMQVHKYSTQVHNNCMKMPTQTCQRNRKNMSYYLLNWPLKKNSDRSVPCLCSIHL